MHNIIHFGETAGNEILGEFDREAESERHCKHCPPMRAPICAIIKETYRQIEHHIEQVRYYCRLRKATISRIITPKRHQFQLIPPTMSSEYNSRTYNYQAIGYQHHYCHWPQPLPTLTTSPYCNTNRQDSHNNRNNPYFQWNVSFSIQSKDISHAAQSAKHTISGVPSLFTFVTRSAPFSISLITTSSTRDGSTPLRI